jgi:hypothetical protein
MVERRGAGFLVMRPDEKCSKSVGCCDFREHFQHNVLQATTSPSLDATGTLIIIIPTPC